MAPNFRLHLPEAVAYVNKLNDKDFEFFEYVLGQEYHQISMDFFDSESQFFIDLWNVLPVYHRVRIDEAEMYVSQFVKDFASGYYKGYDDYDNESLVMSVDDDTEVHDQNQTQRYLDVPETESKLADFNDYELDFFEYVLKNEFNNDSVSFSIHDSLGDFNIFVEIRDLEDHMKKDLDYIFETYEDSVERFTSRFLDGVYEDYRPDFDVALSVFTDL